MCRSSIQLIGRFQLALKNTCLPKLLCEKFSSQCHLREEATTFGFWPFQTGDPFLLWKDLSYFYLVYRDLSIGVDNWRQQGGVLHRKKILLKFLHSSQEIL